MRIIERRGPSTPPRYQRGGRTLHELAREAAVLIWAPRGDRGFKALLLMADLVVWHYEERPATPVRRRRRQVQATLG